MMLQSSRMVSLTHRNGIPMRIISSIFDISHSYRHQFHLNPFITFPVLFSSSSFCTCSPSQTSISNLKKRLNPLLFNYLIDSLGVSKSRAMDISTRLSWVKSLENPQSVVNYFQKLGFTQTQIQSSISRLPQLLYTRIDKTLKPKLDFFQDLGFTGSDLGELISSSPIILSHSLYKRLIPCSQIVKKILINDDKNEVFLRVLRRCRWIIVINPQKHFLTNIAYLESCGVVGSQLSKLFTNQPRLFLMNHSKLTDLISKVIAMGFSMNSRMLVHAILTVSCISKTTFQRKTELFMSFGFSEDEFMDMFRRTPALPRVSEQKLKMGIEFFINTIKLDKLVLFRRPVFLMYSMENRLIPRYKVLQLLKSKKLLKKDPHYANVLVELNEEEFLDKFISKFRDEAGELLMAFKGHLLDSASPVPNFLPTKQ